MNIFEEIDQPTLLLDEGIARANIKKMADKASRSNVQFRPHFKTHQSREIGEWFREYEVSKITVSSVEMAEYFAASGWNDILIAFSVNIRQIRRIAALAECIHLEVLVENIEAIEALASILPLQLDLWVKVDVGNKRTGVDWQDVAEAEQLCRKILSYSNLHLKGLLAHSGHTYRESDSQKIKVLFGEGVDRLRELRDDLATWGISGLEISTGDTPGCSLVDGFLGMDEIRPGNFIFYDAQQLMIGSCTTSQVAVAVGCPVVAVHADRGEVITYGGAVHLSKDYLMINGERTYGLVAFQQGNHWGDPVTGAFVKGLSQEHGVLSLPADALQRVKIGDLVFIIPAHSCLTVQVLSEYLTMEGRRITTLTSQ